MRSQRHLMRPVGEFADTKILKIAEKTYHFIVNFVEVDLTNFVYDVLALKCDESEA